MVTYFLTLYLMLLIAFVVKAARSSVFSSKVAYDEELVEDDGFKLFDYDNLSKGGAIE